MTLATHGKEWYRTSALATTSVYETALHLFIAIFHQVGNAKLIRIDMLNFEISELHYRC